MKSHFFDPFEPISITRFLYDFRLACSANGIHECAAIFLSSFFMMKSVSAVLNTRPASKHIAQTEIASMGKNATRNHIHNYPIRYSLSVPLMKITMIQNMRQPCSLSHQTKFRRNMSGNWLQVSFDVEMCTRIMI